MEERRIDTTICLCGVREAIATILNRAFGFYTRGMVVVEYYDDVCAMNMKIQEANAYMSDFGRYCTLRLTSQDTSSHSRRCRARLAWIRNGGWSTSNPTARRSGAACSRR